MLCTLVSWAVDTEQFNPDELLCEKADFCCRTQEGFTNGRQGPGYSTETRGRTAEARRLREKFEDLNAHRYYLCIQHFSSQDTLNHEESEYSPLTTEHYRLSNDRHQHSSKIVHERGTKRGEPLLIAADFPFEGFNTTKATSTTLHPDFVLSSCSPYSSSLKLIWFQAPLDICKTLN